MLCSSKMFQETEATLFPSQIPRFFTRWLISSFFVSPDLPQQHVYKREEILMDRQLCKQERNSSPDVKEPQPSTIKEEQEDLCISQDLDQPIVKQEYNIVTVTYEESDQSEPEHEHQTHEEFNRTTSSADSRDVTLRVPKPDAPPPTTPPDPVLEKPESSPFSIQMCTLIKTL